LPTWGINMPPGHEKQKWGYPSRAYALALALRRALEGLAEVARGRLRATETSPHVPFANGTPAPGGVVFADQSSRSRGTDPNGGPASLGWPLQRRLNGPLDAYVQSS